MNNKKQGISSQHTLGLVQLSLFTGIIVVMAFIPFIGYIPLGFTRATIIHIPVIIGSLLLGPKKGAFLGCVFGLTSLVNNTINPTVTSFVFSPFYSLGEIQGGIGSIIICMIPRILVGIVPYYIYRLVTTNKANPSKKQTTLGLAFAGILGSLTNTLLVMNLIYLFFKDAYATANEVASDTVYTFILSIIGVNGIPEAIVSGILVVGIGSALMRTKSKF